MSPWSLQVGSVLTSEVVAVDVDQPGPFSTVEYHIPAGPFSQYVAFENPLEGKVITAMKTCWTSCSFVR